MGDAAFLIRRAEPRYLQAVGRMGAPLPRAHHDFDRRAEPTFVEVQ